MRLSRWHGSTDRGLWLTSSRGSTDSYGSRVAVLNMQPVLATVRLDFHHISCSRILYCHAVSLFSFPSFLYPFPFALSPPSPFPSPFRSSLYVPSLSRGSLPPQLGSLREQSELPGGPDGAVPTNGFWCSLSWKHTCWRGRAIAEVFSFQVFNF